VRKMLIPLLPPSNSTIGSSRREGRGEKRKKRRKEKEAVLFSRGTLTAMPSG